MNRIRASSIGIAAAATAAVLVLLAAHTPVSADPLHAAYQDGLVRLWVPGPYWQFVVERAAAPEGPFEYLGEKYIGCTEACEWFDVEIAEGTTYYYRMFLLAQDGGRIAAGPTAVDVPGGGSGDFASWTAPNPFTDRTSISFRLPSRATSEGAANVRVVLRDVTGRTVSILHAGPMGRGVQTVAWDGRDAAGRSLGSGIYYYTIEAADARETGRLLKLR